MNLKRCLLFLTVLFIAGCSAPVVQPERDQYMRDLEFVAQAPRSPGSEHHQSVQDLCAKRFEELGFSVERQDFDVGVNIIGQLAGQKRPDEALVISAHYDSVPDCSGADDNASGVAALLEVARVLASEKHDRTLVMACWDQEENGLLGSEAYADRARQQNANLIGVYVFDSIGFTDDRPGSQRFPAELKSMYDTLIAPPNPNGARGDFIALLYDERFSPPAKDLVGALHQVAVPVLPFEVNLNRVPSDMTRSDHYPFWRNGYPAMQITDTTEFRSPYYHCHGGADDVKTLNQDFVMKIIEAMVTSTRKMLQDAD
ncbi:MAG TPA: M20/M25/M40 family metallo-hydrolase [Anaerolineae bacterium]